MKTGCPSRRRKRLASRFGSMICGIALAASSGVPRAELPTLGDPTLDSISNREEAQLGLAYYRSIMASVPVINDVQLDHYLKSLAQKLVTQSDMAGKQFTFFIVNSSVINAFALPGGYIGVNSGLVLDADTESQLASVLAHEISHVTQRHIARMFDSSGNSTALSIAAILAAILVGSQNPDAGQAMLLGGLAGAQQSSINFTRQNEYEADRIGFGLLVDAGINPEGMVEFFEHLMSQDSGLQIEYIRTHPLDVNRVSEARSRIKEEHRDLPKNSDDFLFAKARLAVLGKTSSVLHQLIELNRDKPGVIPGYLSALALTETGQPGKAAEILSGLAEENTHPWIRLALADAYEEAGRLPQAVKTLEVLHDLYPGYPPVTLAYAAVLNRSRDSARSIELLLHLLQQHRTPAIYEELARAYYLNGQVSAALEATGNQYALQGYMELALQQYQNALNQSGLDDTSRKRLETRKDELMEQVRMSRN